MDWCVALVIVLCVTAVCQTVVYVVALLMNRTSPGDE